MTETERKKIQANVLKIVNRVKKYGRGSERVKIDVGVVLTGQAAINYKVIKLFSPELTDAELVSMLFELGVRNGTEIIKTLAPKHGIQI